MTPTIVRGTPPIRRVGDRALLVLVGEPESTMAVTAVLRQAGLPGVEELIPAAETVLIRLAPDADIAEFGNRVINLLAGFRVDANDAQAGDPLLIPVRYNGSDLPDVARETGLSIAEVVAAHTGTLWRAAFVGFAPGFAYLTGGDPRLRVPRRSESRTSVPAGSVALAGDYCAVYPGQSPGGWQLIGSTDATLWDIDAEPPAAIQPGSWVRFVDTATIAPSSGCSGAGRQLDAIPSKTQSPCGQGDPVTSGHLVVVRTGPLALVQDTGRGGHAGDGVGRSGAADRRSAAQGNALVGNPPGAAVIECTLGGLAVRAEAEMFVAVTGAPAPIDIDGTPVTHATRARLAAGQILRLRTPRTGLRSYLAVAGGVDVPAVLGSRSSDILSGLGPAALAKADVLPVGPTPEAAAGETGDDQPRTALGQEVTELRVIFGPRDDWFDNPDALTTGEWRVSPHSNRVGLRLDRSAEDRRSPTVQRCNSDELPSEGLTLGAIQVPPSGQPVLFLADHPITGGYPVIAVVIDDDVDAAAQLRPGQRVRFVALPGD